MSVDVHPGDELNPATRAFRDKYVVPQQLIERHGISGVRATQIFSQRSVLLLISYDC
jgi:hypothetical protein